MEDEMELLRADFAKRAALPRRAPRPDLTARQLDWCREWIPGFAKTEAQARAMLESREANRREMAA
jgi:hypothetical protein